MEHDNILAFAGIKDKQFSLLLQCPSCQNSFTGGLYCDHCYGNQPVIIKAAGLPLSTRKRLQFQDFVSVIKEQEIKYVSFRKIQTVNQVPTIVNCQQIGFHGLNLSRSEKKPYRKPKVLKPST